MDVFHSKIGDFWIEADGERVKFKLIALPNTIHLNNKNYIVEDRKEFRPFLKSNHLYKSIKFKTNIDYSKFEYVDVLSDEHYSGIEMHDLVTDYTIGISAMIEDTGGVSDPVSYFFGYSTGLRNDAQLPVYIEVEGDSDCRFRLAYKKFVHEYDDLSVDFACDFDFDFGAR